MIKKNCTTKGAILTFYNEFSDELFTGNVNAGEKNRINQIPINEPFSTVSYDICSHRKLLEVDTYKDEKKLSRNSAWSLTFGKKQ